MRRKFLNSVIPFTAELKKLFNKETVQEVRDSLNGNHRIEGSGVIPGATEISMEQIQAAGFKIKFYLKDATDSAVDTYDSGIVIASIQHEDPLSCTLIDGLSYQFDPKSEVEISTLSSMIVHDEVPEAFGKDYKIDELIINSSLKIVEINTEMANNKAIRDEKIKQYEANPEMARKHTKKALENLRFKHVELLASKVKDNKAIEDFQINALRLIGEMFGINGITKFEDLKQIPEIKVEIEKGGSLTELLENMSKVVSAKMIAEEIEAPVKNLEKVELEEK